MSDLASAPAVSVVLPVLNEARDLPGLLEQILGQKPPTGGFEVLVADGGSTDGTQDIVARLMARHADLKLLDNPRKLSSAGRNVGARAARGKYVLFLDGHCSLPRNDYLVRLVEIFESTGAACLSRPQPLNRLTDNPWAEAISAARHSWLGHNPGSDIYGGEPGYTDPRSAGAAYTREVIERLGGYDERFDACEDVEFNHRVAVAGLRAYRHPDLTVEYRPRADLRGLFRQMVRYGRGRARLQGRHPEAVAWPLVVETIVVAAAAATFVWAGPAAVGPWFAGGAATIVTLVALVSWRLGDRVGFAARAALAIFTIHAGLLLGFWRGLADCAQFYGPAYSDRPRQAP